MTGCADPALPSVACVLGVVVLAPDATRAQAPLVVVEAQNPDVHIDVTGLKRIEDGTVMLRWTAVNASGQRWIGPPLADTYLLDMRNRKKYLVITDSKGECLCSTGRPLLDAGQSIRLWVRFPRTAGQRRGGGRSLARL